MPSRLVFSSRYLSMQRRVAGRTSKRLGAKSMPIYCALSNTNSYEQVAMGDWLCDEWQAGKLILTFSPLLSCCSTALGGCP